MLVRASTSGTGCPSIAVVNSNRGEVELGRPRQGAPVPKRMNQLGLGGSPVPGPLLTPDPAERTRALAEARAEQE